MASLAWASSVVSEEILGNTEHRYWLVVTQVSGGEEACVQHVSNSIFVFPFCPALHRRTYTTSPHCAPANLPWCLPCQVWKPEPNANLTYFCLGTLPGLQPLIGHSFWLLLILAPNVPFNRLHCLISFFWPLEKETRKWLPQTIIYQRAGGLTVSFHCLASLGHQRRSRHCHTDMVPSGRPLPTDLALVITSR